MKLILQASVIPYVQKKLKEAPPFSKKLLWLHYFVPFFIVSYLLEGEAIKQVPRDRRKSGSKLRFVNILREKALVYLLQ
jgi:hypothetical protein